MYLKEQPKRKVSIITKEYNNLCVSILRKIKRDYFGNLDNKIVTDNRKLWKAISLLFSEKAFHRECITSRENKKTITNNAYLAEANLNIGNNLRDIITNPILLIQFSVQSKSMKSTQTFSKLRK